MASRLASLFSYPFIPAAVNVRPGFGDAHLKHASRLAKLDLPHLTHVQSALLGLALESSAAAVAPGPAPAFVSLLRAAFATARRIAGGVYLPPALVPMPFRMGVFDVPAVGDGPPTPARVCCAEGSLRWAGGVDAGSGLTGAFSSDFASRVLPSAAAAAAAAAMRRAFRASVATMVRVTVAPPSLISCRILRHR